MQMQALLLLLCASLAVDAVQASSKAPETGVRRGAAAPTGGLQSDNQTGYVVAWGDLEYIGTPPVTTNGGIVKISAGMYHALALTAKGQAIVWGDTSGNQTSIPDEALTDVVDIAAGYMHSLVLLRNGSILAWGDNTFGACNVPAELKDGSVTASAIAAGDGISVALVDGGVRVWGDNITGVLVVPSDAHTGIVAIAVGAAAVLAQKADNTLVQWGLTTNLPPAVQKGPLKGPGTFANGWDQIAALTSDGSIAVWKAGDLDYPSIWDPVSTPPPDRAAGTYMNISAGTNYTLALTSGGEVVAWGYDGSGTGVLSIPAIARSNVLAVSAGAEGFGLALVAGTRSDTSSTPSTTPATLAPVATSGYAYAWGDDTYGAISGVPAQALSQDIVKVSAGKYHALALTSDGVVLGWGNDFYKQTSGVVQHMGTDRAMDVSAGSQHNIVLLRNGTVRAWGENNDGQCNVPDFGGVRVRAVSAGGQHSLALLENGTVVAWGNSEKNQALVPVAAQSHIVAIETGSFSSLAVTSNGTLIQWGDVTTELPEVVREKGVRTTPGSISAGYNHMVAILRDGTIAAWPVAHPAVPEVMDQVLAAPPGRAKFVSAGYNFSAAVMETGEVVVWGGPSGALTLANLPSSPVLQVSAGSDFALAVKRKLALPTGHVVAWGDLQWVGTPPITTQADVVKIAAGRYHALALRSNGEVIVWGNTAWSQTSERSDALTDVVDIAAGATHSLALRSDGSILAWGDNSDGACNVPAGIGSKATAIAAGYGVSIAVVNGGVIVWGSNSSGQLLVPEEAHTGIVSVAAGVFAMLAQKSDGTLVQWGASSPLPAAVQKGAAKGLATMSSGWDQAVAITKGGSIAVWSVRDPPQSPAAVEEVIRHPLHNAPGTYKAVSAGYNFTVALTTKGEVVAWGYDWWGTGVLSVPAAARSDVMAIATGGANFGLALVAGSSASAASSASLTPVATSGYAYAWGDDSYREVSGVPAQALSQDIVKVSAGRHHALALTYDGMVLGWGDDAYKQTSGVVQHMGTDTVSDVSAGGWHNMALMSDGTVRAWGWNRDGQCNVPDFGEVRVRAVSAGGWHSLALLVNGTVVAWGNALNNRTQVPMAAQAHIVAIAAGAFGNLAVTSNGTLIQWGDVSSDLPEVVKKKGVRTTPGSISAGYDQMAAILTDGSIAAWQVAYPYNLDLMDQVLAAPPGRAVFVSAGYNFSAAVMETGEVVVWGGPSTALSLAILPRSPVLQVSAGEDFAVAIKGKLSLPTGNVLAWGDLQLVGTPPISTQADIVKTSAGRYHALALNANGKVIEWGADDYNQIYTAFNNAALTDVVDIAAGADHSLALLSDGSILAWGDNSDGACNVPAGIGSKATAIAAGYGVSMAVVDGGVIVWGSNSSGQLLVPKEAQAGVIAVAAGVYSVLAQKKDGRLLQWGASRHVPAAAQKARSSIQGLATISSGWGQAAAVSKDGSMAVWNATYLLDAPAINYQVVTSPPNNAPGTYKAVSAGWNFTMALTTSGEVIAWGYDDGNNVLSVPLGAKRNVIGIAAGGASFGLALVAGEGTSVISTPSPEPLPVNNTGSAYIWGNDDSGGGSFFYILPGGLIKVSAGRYHSVALLDNGLLYPWGQDMYGQTTEASQHVRAGELAVDVSAGGAHTMALLSDGTVRAWGLNDNGQCSVPDFGGMQAKAVSAGFRHSLALLRNGTVVAWGGSSPDGHSNQTQVPAAAQLGIVAIAAGVDSSMAVTSNGTLLQWGDATSELPEVVKRKGVRTTSGSISAGYHQFVAILTDGSIAVWPVVRPDSHQHAAQLTVPPAGRAVSVSAGYTFSAAVMETGEVVVWGAPDPAFTTPLLPQSQVLQVAVGQDFAIVLVADLPMPKVQPGSLIAWGPNVPQGAPITESSIVKVSAGAEHVMVLLADGTVRVWGNPARTDLLNTSLVDLLTVVDIAAGQQHCLAMLSNRTVVAWGAAGYDYGQTNTPSNTLASQAFGIAAGYYHSLVLNSNGSISGWGNNATGELLPPDNTTGNTIAVAAGAGSSFAFLRKNSSQNKDDVVAWGDVGAVPDAVLQDAVSVAGGWNHSVAILRNGSVMAWPSSSSTDSGTVQQLLAVPAGIHATAVDANSYHSVALLTSGQVVTWGAADNITLAVPPAVASSKVLGVAAGLNFTVAIVEVETPQVQQVNGAAGCNSAPNQFGYKCNRALTGLPGDWQLSYTVSSSPVPPSSPCTAGVTSDAANQRLPPGATHWVHIMTSSSAQGWIAMSYPDSLDRMYPAKAILGYMSSAGGFIHTYQLTNNSLPAPDNTSWAINMGAAKSTDGRSIICFAQPAVINNVNSTHSRRLQQAPASNILDLNKGMHIHIASSPSADITQKHTVVGAASVGLTTGNTAMTLLGPRVSQQEPKNNTGPSFLLQSPADDTSTGLTSGAIAGIVVGSVAGLTAILGLLAYWLHRRQQLNHSKAVATKSVYETDIAGTTTGPGLEGVAQALEGDVFLVATAKEYGWITSANLEGPLEAVEAGINDIQQGPSQQPTSTGMTSTPTSTDAVVQLTGEELRAQVQLLSDGLLGRGATALVFKCIWPSKFGPNRLLAAKVVKDGYDDNVWALESFKYEANVLSSAQHPNVVRMYGYCLEPPTLCLILELLPTSLKDVLYKGMAYPGATRSFHTCLSAGYIPTKPHEKALQPNAGHLSTSSTAMVTVNDGAFCIDMASADGSTEVQVTSSDKAVFPAGKGLGEHGLTSADRAMALPAPKLNCLQVVRLATEIASGLAYLHGSTDLPTQSTDEELMAPAEEAVAGSPVGRLKIVHRDMKPANILINSKGVAKISDFGLARHHEHTTVATAHLGVGTLPYMAPELLAAARLGAYAQAVTNRVDIYSLSMMLWEMISGRAPWKDMSEVAIMAAVSQKQRPPLPGDMTFKDTAALQEVANQPASPAAIPQLNKLIRACWNQRDLKRPQAREVYAKLVVLLADMQGPVQAKSAAHTVVLDVQP